MKTRTTTLAAVFAIASCLAAAHGAPRHAKEIRHPSARFVEAPTSRRMPFTRSVPCPILGMGTANEVGVDNDANVYRDRPFC